MPSLPAPRGPVPPLPAARGSSRARWLGAVACAAVLSGWFVASRTDGSEPLALSAEGAGREALSATSLDLPGDQASASLTRKPAPSAVDQGAPGPVPESTPMSVTALLVAGRVVVLGGSGAEDAPLAQARLYVEAQRRHANGRLDTWSTTPLRARSDATGRFSIAQPAEGTPEAKAIAPSTRHGQQLAGLRVTARRIGHVDASVEFEPGAADVHLALASAGWLTVRIVHGGAEDGPRFSLELIAGEERFARAKVEHEREIFNALPAGDASLIVRLQGDTEPLVVLQNLVVPPGAACDDPRLDPLDVSARVADYAVRVVNDRGEAVQRPMFGVVGVALEDVDDAPVGGLRARADTGAAEVLGEGWWRVHARAPVPPDVVVQALDHFASAPATLHDGATITLRSMPRFLVELTRDPPQARIQFQSLTSSGPSESVSLPAARVLRVPKVVTGRARARLTQGGERGGALPDVWEPATTGPWVEFEVPESGEGRVLLDLTL